jgi:hypothetical protein
LKKNVTRFAKHWSRISCTQAFSMGRAPGPLSSPTITQFGGHREGRRQTGEIPRLQQRGIEIDLLPLLTANGSCGLGEGTFATTRSKGQDAPTPAVGDIANEPSSTPPGQGFRRRK